MPSDILQNNERKKNQTIEWILLLLHPQFRITTTRRKKIVNSPPYICVQLQRIHRRVCALITKKVLDVLPSFYPFTYRHFPLFSYPIFVNSYYRVE